MSSNAQSPDDSESSPSNESSQSESASKSSTDADDDDSSPSIQRPNTNPQMKFTDDGNLEVDKTPVETTFADFGADVDTQERETRIDQGASEEFVDDRTVRPGSDEDDSEQDSLFVGADEDQRSLTGETEAKCPFEKREATDD